MSIYSRLGKHLLLWCFAIGVELGIRWLLKSFGANLVPAEVLSVIERCVGLLTGATLMVTATSTAGEVIAIAVKGLLQSATDMVNDGVAPLLTAVRKLSRKELERIDFSYG
jgi:hypothetical protein